MQILVILGIAAVCLGAASVYIALRPGLGRIQDGLNALVAFGRDQAEIRFIHHRRGRDIIFRREIIGGVPQILLVTQGLKLAAGEEKKLHEFLESRGLKVETRKKSKKGKSTKVVVLGHSAQRATDIATKL